MVVENPLIRPRPEQRLTPVHSADLMTGLLAGLARLGLREIPLEGNRFDSALLDAFIEFEEAARRQGLTPMFLFRAGTAGRSLGLRQAMREAAGRGIAGFPFPGESLAIRILPEQADAYLRRLPGPPEMYIQLAQAVRQTLRGL